jgi:hypothetical protein
VAGSFPTYRTVVNLGSGPKLIALDFTILDPRHRWFDRVDARANSWGGEPYNTAHLDIRKKNIYDLSADYRNIAYFNALPSFANPFAPLGFDQRSFDTRNRTGYANLELFPGTHLIPYLAFERNSIQGQGIETWVQEANNEFPVPIQLRDSTNNYRGGLRVEFNRWHTTVEQGGTTYKNDDQAGFNGVNYGNRQTPILGTTSVLNTLGQFYNIRGSSVYTKVLATGSPLSFLDVYGQFLYSRPTTNSRYFDVATGNFALLSSLLIYNGQYDISNGAANASHILGNAGVEARPFRRLRIINSFTSNRFDATGIGALTEQILLSPGVSGPTLFTALTTPQRVTINTEQIEAIYELTSKVILRGGYRREWGDATVRAGALDPSGPLAVGDLRRNVALAGATVRPFQKLSLNADYESAGTGQDFFRDTLYTYYKVRARARYQPYPTLWFQANFSFLDNQNPTLGIQQDFRSRDNALAVFWTPNGGKRVSVMAEYNRSTVFSSIDYLVLPFLTAGTSVYQDNSHTATATIDVLLPEIVRGYPLKLTAGGSLFISTGTRPTSYYQPVGRLSVPVHKHVQWITEWRWYGFSEVIYSFENFQTHMFFTGLKVTK